MSSPMSVFGEYPLFALTVSVVTAVVVLFALAGRFAQHAAATLGVHRWPFGLRPPRVQSFREPPPSPPPPTATAGGVLACLYQQTVLAGLASAVNYVAEGLSTAMEIWRDIGDEMDIERAAAGHTDGRVMAAAAGIFLREPPPDDEVLPPRYEQPTATDGNRYGLVHAATAPPTSSSPGQDWFPGYEVYPPGHVVGESVLELAGLDILLEYDYDDDDGDISEDDDNDNNYRNGTIAYLSVLGRMAINDALDLGPVFNGESFDFDGFIQRFFTT